MQTHQQQISIPAVPAAIQVVGLTKRYGNGSAAFLALNGVSFCIEKGEYVAIVGPSGSGKSTLLNLIGALDRPTSGKIFLDGVDLSRLPNTELARIRNKKVGFVFQSFNLIPRISVVENVELPLVIAGAQSRERRKIALHLLDQFGIASKARRTPKELSGGEQQRVAVARALANDPAVVLADEPTGNLDTKNTGIMMELLEDLHKRTAKTLVIITHSKEVSSRAGKVISLRDGQIEEVKVD